MKKVINAKKTNISYLKAKNNVISKAGESWLSKRKRANKKSTKKSYLYYLVKKKFTKN